MFFHIWPLPISSKKHMYPTNKHHGFATNMNENLILVKVNLADGYLTNKHGSRISQTTWVSEPLWCVGSKYFHQLWHANIPDPAEKYLVCRVSISHVIGHAIGLDGTSVQEHVCLGLKVMPSSQWRFSGFPGVEINRKLGTFWYWFKEQEWESIQQSSWTLLQVYCSNSKIRTCKNDVLRKIRFHVFFF